MSIETLIEEFKQVDMDKSDFENRKMNTLGFSVVDQSGAANKTLLLNSVFNAHL